MVATKIPCFVLHFVLTVISERETLQLSHHFRSLQSLTNSWNFKVGFDLLLHASRLLPPPSSFLLPAPLDHPLSLPGRDHRSPTGDCTARSAMGVYGCVCVRERERVRASADQIHQQLQWV